MNSVQVICPVVCFAAAALAMRSWRPADAPSTADDRKNHAAPGAPAAPVSNIPSEPSGSGPAKLGLPARPSIDEVFAQPDPACLIQHTVGETLRRHPDQAFALLASLSPEHLSSVREKWRLSFNLSNIAGTSAALAASALDPEVKQIMAGFPFRRPGARSCRGRLLVRAVGS